mgnify:CR=1 FL=1
MKFLPKRHEPEDLNISPLIDMVFILLIFFAVSTTFVKDMQLDLEPVKTWMLQSLVRDSLAVSSSQNVLVISDRLVPTEKLVDVVDQCKLAGADEVGVATQLE